MKKYMPLILAALLLLSGLSACSGEEAAPSGGVLNETQDATATDEDVSEKIDAKAAFVEVLPEGYKTLEIEDFDAWLSEQEGPVFLDFWASWCGPCRMAAPEVKKLAEELSGSLRVLEINVDYMPASLAATYDVQAIPSFYLIDGEESTHWLGLVEGLFDEVREAVE